MLVSLVATLKAQPTFAPNQDPKPSGQQWVLVENISDEFDGTSLDEAKWQNTDPSRWRGRAPGIFKEDAVSLANGNLQVTTYQLTTPEVVNGDTYTHAGGNLYSQEPGYVGYYYECRMKANQTFMSSTFWLINTRGEGTDCDRRTTELDIQECVGQVVTTSGWAQSFDQSMHSNTHSRNADCASTPIGSAGDDVDLTGKVWADYHVYGAWWKTPTEIEFYLDGVKVYTVNPVAEFNLPMYLRLVTETYNWNPVPPDGGMTGTAAERTTYYDWVRSWQLEVDTTTSIATPAQPALNMYPNPATEGAVTVELGDHLHPVRIDIRDVHGRVMATTWSRKQKETLSLEGLSQGVYVLEVYTKAGKQVGRLVVQ